MNWMDILKREKGKPVWTGRVPKWWYKEKSYEDREEKETNWVENKYYRQYMKDLEAWLDANPFQFKHNTEEFYKELDKLPLYGDEIKAKKLTDEEHDEWYKWSNRQIDVEEVKKFRKVIQAEKDEKLRIIREKEEEEKRIEAEYRERLAQSKKTPKGTFGAKRTAGKRVPSWKKNR